MQHFHRLKVHLCRKESNDSMHLGFQIPKELKHQFLFKQGQYLTLRFVIDHEDLRRSYSIVNAPSDKNPLLEVLVKKIDDGRVSKFIYENIKEGDEIEVLAPQGHFYTHYHPSNQKTYVGIAAGSGISPVLSNVIEALYQEPQSNAYLFFSNRSNQDTIFKDRINALENQFQGRLKVVYLFSREKHESDSLFEGRITSDKLNHLLKYFSEIQVQEATYFICGPTAMIKSLAQFLREEKKVPSLQVMYEYYTPPDEGDDAEKSEEFKKIPNLESFVTLIIDDDEYDIHLNSKKESILDKAIKENLPVPFACKGGVCCTCKAQVMEGEVFMEKNFALTEDEVARGFVLTCQCHPITNIVMLNYDV